MVNKIPDTQEPLTPTLLTNFGQGELELAQLEEGEKGPLHIPKDASPALKAAIEDINQTLSSFPTP